MRTFDRLLNPVARTLSSTGGLRSSIVVEWKSGPAFDSTHTGWDCPVIVASVRSRESVLTAERAFNPMYSSGVLVNTSCSVYAILFLSLIPALSSPHLPLAQSFLLRPHPPAYALLPLIGLLSLPLSSTISYIPSTQAPLPAMQAPLRAARCSARDKTTLACVWISKCALSMLCIYDSGTLCSCSRLRSVHAKYVYPDPDLSTSLLAELPSFANTG